MISVVVPVYKSEKTFVSCVESLLGQTCRDLEILLVDDGSPDNCPQLCDELARKDGRIRVIHKENGGVSSARNAGIEAAEGEYLFFCDSDDWVEPEMLEKLLLGMAGGDFALCGFHHHYLGADVVKTPDSADFLELYGRGFLNMPWNKLFKRELAGRFDESLSLGEDLLFNLDYLRRADGIHVVGEALYHYIQNDTGETLSSQKRDNKLELAKLIWRETSRFYEEETGQKDESGRINARLIQECLDDMESLPADKTRTRKEKLAVIASYLEDTDIRAAGGCAALGPLDYRMLHFCLRHRLKRTAYLLCVLRNVLVQALRKRKV